MVLTGVKAGEEIEKAGNGQRIEREGALPAERDDAAGAQDAQLLGDNGLGSLQLFLQSPYRGFPPGEDLDQPEPQGMAESLEDLGDIRDGLRMEERCFPMVRFLFNHI